MCLDERLADGQADAAAAALAASGGVGAVEPLEDVDQMVGVDAFAVVAHSDLDPVRVRVALGDPNPSAGRGVLERVVEQVGEHLGHAVGVGQHGACRQGVHIERDLLCVEGVVRSSRGRLNHADRVREHGWRSSPHSYHPHSGVQLDRGLYGVLVVDDKNESGAYDAEWIVVLDDWVDGTGQTPDDVLAMLRQCGAGGMEHGSMGGMPMGGMGGDMQSPILGGAGDVAYPRYLVNGRVAASPVTLSAKPGQRVRIRMVNAASDTAFRVALGGHRLSVTHSDGFPVASTEADALLIGMGERFDVVVTLGDGSFPLVASAEGKSGQGMALVRTAGGEAPAPDV